MSAWMLVDGPISASAIAKRLDQHGACVVPAYLSQEHVSVLRDEALAALRDHGTSDYGYGRSCRFEPEGYDAVRAAAQFFQSELFEQVVEAYLPREQVRHLRYIDITHDFRFDPTTIYGKLHYDRRRQLKFMLYLLDTDPGAGAFRFVPGSHVDGQRLHTHAWRAALGAGDEISDEAIAQMAWMTPDASPAYRSVEFLCPERAREAVHASGPAGSLVVFDTHVLHAGGIVDEGRERLNVKSHSLVELSA